MNTVFKLLFAVTFLLVVNSYSILYGMDKNQSLYYYQLPSDYDRIALQLNLNQKTYRKSDKAQRIDTYWVKYVKPITKLGINWFTHTYQAKEIYFRSPQGFQLQVGPHKQKKASYRLEPNILIKFSLVAAFATCWYLPFFFKNN